MNISRFNGLYSQKSAAKQNTPSFRGILVRNSMQETCNAQEYFNYEVYLTYYPFNDETEEEINKIKKEYHDYSDVERNPYPRYDVYSSSKLTIKDRIDSTKKQAEDYQQFKRQGNKIDTSNYRQMKYHKEFEKNAKEVQEDLDVIKKIHGEDASFEVIV